MDNNNDKYQNIINKFFECNQFISKNEEHFKNLQNNEEDSTCYLIDNNLFKKLKDDLNYEAFKTKQKDEYEEIIKKQIESNSTLLSYNIKKFEQINNIAILLNVLFSTNEIILIKKELWEKICKEGKEKEEACTYFFGGSEINIFLSDNITVNFAYNNNIGIITLNSFYDSNQEIKNKIKENKDKLLKLLNSMKEYFLFEKKFSDNKIEINKNYSGFLVDKKVIDEWKKNTCYEKLKFNYFEKGICRIDERKVEILNYMAFLYIDNNFIDKISFEIESLSSDKLKDFNIKNHMVLISKDLYKLMNNNQEKERKEINYRRKNKTLYSISFLMDNKDNIDITTTLSNNTIYSYTFRNLQILINYFYNQKLSIEKIKRQNKSNFEVAYIMDKSLFNNFKDFFSYEQLSSYLKRRKLEDNEDLKEETIIEIIESLPNEYMKKIDKKMEKKPFDIKVNAPQFGDKIINFGQKKINFKFLINFEFLDMNKIIMPLIQLNRKDIINYFIIVRYYSISEKTIILFKEDNQNYSNKDIFLGQIGNFNNNNEFIIEYLIYLIYFDKKLCYTDLDKLIKKFGFDNFIKKIYNNEPVKLADKIEFYYYNVNNNSNENLELLLTFCQAQKKIYQNIQNSNNNDEEYYLISKKWLDEFKTIFLFNEIFPLLKPNENYFSDKNEFEIIIQNISNKIRTKLDDSVNNNLSKLNDKDLYTIDYNNINDDFFLMDQEVYDKLKDIILNLEKQTIEKVKCLFRDKKIFISSEKTKRIIIGSLDNTDLINQEVIINYMTEKNEYILMKVIYIQGYKYIKYLLFKNNIDAINGQKTKILNLTSNLDENGYEEKKPLISDQLLGFMLLNDYQEYILEETNNYNDNNINKTKESIIPINLSDLQQILNLIKEIINIIPKFKKIWNKYNGQKNFLNDIKLDLDINKMNKIKKTEKICQKYDNYNNLFMLPNNIKLHNNKNINIYNNFGFINKKILDLLIGNSNLNKQNIIIKATYDKKSIAIINNNEQHTMLIGSIINNKNVFELEYILEFKDEYNLFDQIDQIYKSYSHYASDKLVFNDKYEGDCVSPIFDNNEIIGYGYKYKEKFNNDYSEYNIKDDFINSIHLATYYEFINNLINLSKNKYYELSSNDYKLVSSKWITDVKTKFNMNKINEELESNNDFKNEIQKYNNDNNIYKLNCRKNIYSIIKTISPNICKELNKYNFNKNIENEILPSINQVKYKDYNMNDQEIYIYNDFELINNDIINLFKTEDNNNIGNNFNECYIKDGFIFINFSKQENGNNKLITLIGKLNKNNIFKTEAILIYDTDNEDKRNKHIIGINDVQNFLSNYGNDSEPFTDENYHILGTIVKYESTEKNNGNNNYTINNGNIKVYEENNKDLKKINNNSASDKETNFGFRALGNIKKENHKSQLFSINTNINNNTNNIHENNFISKDNMISISFISDDQAIQNYNKTYKDTELFVNAEKELYENYPEYREIEPFFLVRGNKIKRFKTLKDNNIHNGDVIMLNSYNED